MEAREPGQVRKKAAVSGTIHVPEGSPARAGGKSSARVAVSITGAQHIHRVQREGTDFRMDGVLS